MENRQPNRVTISRLRIAAAHSDALGARLCFERLLSAADLHPPGISERAIICIKKINARPPSGDRLPSDAGGWEKAVRDEIERYFRRAFRPAREIVPAHAESIVFEDRAELLACLARDWLRGELATRWWWRGLFPNLLRRAPSIAAIWLESVEATPFAFGILYKSHEAAAFVKKLELSETTSLLNRLIRVFGLHKLAAVFSQPPEKRGDGAFDAPVGNDHLFESENGRIAATSVFFALNSRSDPEMADLTFEGRCLLETAILLAVDPQRARSDEFAGRVRSRRAPRLFKALSAARSGTERKPRIAIEQGEPNREEKFRRAKKKLAPPAEPRKKRRREIRLEISRKSAKSLRKTENSGRGQRKTAAVDAPKQIGENQRSGAKKSPEIEFDAARTEKQIAPPAAPLRKTSKIESERKIVESQTEDIFEFAPTVPEFDFQTGFGGVFYLLNLGLYLGLYRDFTEPAADEIDLNVWDFVALLGLEFIGERIKEDAVWAFFKQMAQRGGDDEFGGEFERFRDWRVQNAWLETFPYDRPWIAATNGGRLVVRHAAGFNVLDAAAGENAPARLRKESALYRQFYSEIREAKETESSLVKPQSWLANLAEFLEKRLFQALNVRTRPELSAVLFERRAAVSVSATHLDVTFGLADLPVEIRLAGIDRDPGWIPAAGRYVYFHFV